MLFLDNLCSAKLAPCIHDVMGKSPSAYVTWLVLKVIVRVPLP